MTLQDFSESAAFQGLFQAELERVAYLRNRQAVDVMFTKSAEFSLTSTDGVEFTGRFEGEVEADARPSGPASGVLHLHLPDGLEGDDVHRILNDATLDVVIEVFPGWEDMADAIV